MFTLPREVTLGADNKLLIRPAKEVEQLRKQLNNWPIGKIKNERVALMSSCQSVEVIIKCTPIGSDAERYGLTYGNGLKIYVDSQMQRLVLERDYPQQSLADVSGVRSIPLTEGEELELRVFIDNSSVEVFVNDGEAVLSSRIYPDCDQKGLELFALNGSAIFSKVGVWSLE